MTFCTEPPSSQLLPGLGHARLGRPFPSCLDVYEKAKQEKCVALVKGREGSATVAQGG